MAGDNGFLPMAGFCAKHAQDMVVREVPGQPGKERLVCPQCQEDELARIRAFLAKAPDYPGGA